MNNNKLLHELMDIYIKMSGESEARRQLFLLIAKLIN